MSPLVTLICVNDPLKPHERQSTKFHFLGYTGPWAKGLVIQPQHSFCNRTSQNFQNGVPNIEIVFSMSRNARNAEPAPTFCSKQIKHYPQLKFLCVTFDRELKFQKLSQENFERCISSTKIYVSWPAKNGTWPVCNSITDLERMCPTSF